jgi:hypothetical protein
MTIRCSGLGGVAIVATLLLAPGGAAAQGFSIFGTFDADTPGSLPAIGGPDQPTGFLNGGIGVLVQTSSSGIATQPLEVADGTCSNSPFYFGGVYYNLPAAVTGGVLRIEATVAANQLTNGVFFDTLDLGAAVARLRFQDNGTIVDQFGVVLSSYAANTPVRFRADIDMDAKTWAGTIDDELNGFGDDPVVSGLAFVNDPASITQVDTVYLDLLGSFNIFTCTVPRAVAFDDVLIAAPAPLLVDGFESGGTTAWSNTVP